MARKNALRELSRQLPSRPEIDKIIDMLADKDDLHTAIIAVSIVEAHLQKLIVTRLHRTDANFTNRLFENRGPLSDFNSKILVAEAFGLLTGGLAAELHVLRAIRNTFAHARMPLSFDLPEVEKEIRNLKMLIGMGAVGTFVNQLAPRKAFLLVVRLLLILIDEVAKKKSSANKVLARALMGKRG